MKERPILFSAPMVRALLEGRKTVTRRIMKPQPVWVADPSVPFKTTDADPKGIIACPFGRAGDRLWVRETWMENHSGPEINGHGQPLYRASWGNTPEGQHWKPSIFMPRWACRLSLEITKVKAERLQDITGSECLNEGVSEVMTGGYDFNYGNIAPAKSNFRRLWESINGAGSWVANPWVWAVSFQTAKPA